MLPTLLAEELLKVEMLEDVLRIILSAAAGAFLALGALAVVASLVSAFKGPQI